MVKHKEIIVEYKKKYYRAAKIIKSGKQFIIIPPGPRGVHFSLPEKSDLSTPKEGPHFTIDENKRKQQVKRHIFHKDLIFKRGYKLGKEITSAGVFLFNQEEQKPPEIRKDKVDGSNVYLIDLSKKNLNFLFTMGDADGWTQPYTESKLWPDENLKICWKQF